MTKEKPLLIYDGDCGFCKRWIAYWKELTDGAVEYAPSEEVASGYPKIPKKKFDESVVLVLPDGQVFYGANAVFNSLARASEYNFARVLVWIYQNLPGFAWVTEFLYRLVAKNRVFFSKITYALWGKEIHRPTYFRARWIYLRLLGAIYLAAFGAMSVQVLGLAGEHGLIPPSFSDFQLNLFCGLGISVSICLILDFFSFLSLILAWVFYFLLTQACQEFLWFQWDNLLLEMGFISIFFAPFRVFPIHPKKLASQETVPSGVLLFLLKAVLFKVMFGSGLVKLISGDLSWRNLTALNYHFETQPLPTALGWVFHQFSSGVHQILAVMVLIVELGAPFLIFLPRKARNLACIMLVGFQVLINATGNYGFFGLQVIALCILLLDDQTLRNSGSKKLIQPPSELKWFRLGLAAAGVWMGVFPKGGVSEFFAPFRFSNSYGVFAVMTTTRDEIVIEGSNDGQNWKPYSFHWKPGDPARIPGWIQPYMPRLDWQMWFAALVSFENERWLKVLFLRLLEGSPRVLALLSENPFLDRPPQSIRAVIYRYHFTDYATYRATRNWWNREYRGLFSPSFSLKRK